MHKMGWPMMHRMGGSSLWVIRVPQLPPGNAKLQVEMEGAILQQVGKIVQEYAARAHAR